MTGIREGACEVKESLFSVRVPVVDQGFSGGDRRPSFAAGAPGEAEAEGLSKRSLKS
jgi:hypothetical protein